ncbi:MAG TPA: tRNA pseudouridine(13) synthase TruD [archaeon]|nr:tRNA pseudouridine(13) synthase TruD [archaeon]
MQYSLSSKTFFVTELFKPQLSQKGLWNYYTVEKKDLSHKQLLKRLPKDALFCGVKDRNATTKQFMCTKQAIEDIEENNLRVNFIGKSEEKLFIGAHKANAFKVLVEMNEIEVKKLKMFREKNELVANYFGKQRFSINSWTMFELLQKENYENTLKLFLTQKTKFDTEKSSTIKKVIENNWRNWKSILEHEEIKGTGKVVLFEYLEKNPKNFKEAFIPAEPKSVKQLIKTIEAIKWNSELKKEILLKKPNNFFCTIFEEKNPEEFPLLASKAMKRELTIIPTEFENQFFKNKLERKTFFNAKHFSIKKENKNQYWLNFELGKGNYATIFLKYLEKYLEN